MSGTAPPDAASGSATATVQATSAVVCTWQGTASGSAAPLAPSWSSGQTWAQGRVVTSGGSTWYANARLTNDTTGPGVNAGWTKFRIFAGGFAIKNIADPANGIQPLYWSQDSAVSSSDGSPVNAGASDSGPIGVNPGSLYVVASGSVPFCIVGLSPTT